MKPTQDKLKEWEKEENYFQDSEGKIAIHIESRGNIPLPEYISDLLSSQRAKIREEVEKKRFTQTFNNGNLKGGQLMRGYNLALDAILAILTKSL